MKYILKRFFSFYFDILILMLPFTIIVSKQKFPASLFDSNFGILDQIILSLIIIIYYCLCDYLFGRSLGKMIFKLKIDGYDRTKQNKLIRQIIVRNVSRFIPIDFITLLFYDDYRMWHDLLSKTKVVANKKMTKNVVR